MFGYPEYPGFLGSFPGGIKTFEVPIGDTLNVVDPCSECSLGDLKERIEKIFDEEGRSKIIFENILIAFKEKEIIGRKDGKVGKKRQRAFDYFCDILDFYGQFGGSSDEWGFVKEIEETFGGKWGEIEGDKNGRTKGIDNFINKYVSAPKRKESSLYRELKQRNLLNVNTISDYWNGYKNVLGVGNPFVIGPSREELNDFINEYKDEDI